MKFNRAQQFFLGAAMMVAVLCSATAQAYDPDFDYNADGVVDDLDVALIEAAFNATEGDDAFNAIFDHDGDGFVGGSDVNLTLAAAAAQ